MAGSSGTYDTVTWDVVRGAAKLKLMLRDTTEFDDNIDYFISECYSQKLRSKSTVIHAFCSLELEDKRVGCLPKGFMDMCAIWTPNPDTETNNGLPGLSLVLGGSPFLVWANSSIIPQENSAWGRTFMIQNGKIYFNQEVGDQVNIYYLSKNLDRDGYPCILERYVGCLSSYAAYMVGSSDPKRWPNYSIFRGEFIHGKNQIQMDDFKDSFDHARALIMTLMSQPYTLPISTYGRQY
jgi:hypothetical protein